MVNPAFKQRRAKLVSASSGETPISANEPAEVAAENTVDLSELWAALLENYRFMLIVGLVLFAFVMGLTMVSRMTFKSSGRLYLGELEAKRLQAATTGSLDLSGMGAGDLSSEMEILKSQTLISRAISACGFNVALVPRGWKYPRFWKWLASSRNPHLLDEPVRLISARDTALHDNSQGEQKYRVEFKSQTRYEVFDEQGALLGSGRLGLPLVVQGLTLTLAPGVDHKPEPGQVFDMTVRPVDATTDAVLSRLTISSPKMAAGDDPAKVITLEFIDGSPHFAATLLRELMNAYLVERQSWKTEDASAAERFVTKQLGTLRDSLDRTERKLAEYRSNNPVVVLDNEANAMVEQMGKYEEQRLQARLLVASLSEVRRVLKTDSPDVESFMIGETRDSVFIELSDKLSQLRSELADAEHLFGAASPDLQQARNRVRSQLDTVRSYVSNRLARAQENLNSLNQLIAQFEAKLKTVPGAELGLAQLGRESEVYSRVYSYMLERQQQAAITKASTVSKNRVLDNPKVPYREDSPRLSLRLAVGPLALLFGAFLVILQRFLSAAFHSENEIRRAVAGFPIFSALPKRSAPSRAAVDPIGLDLSSPYAEGLRTLRTNLYHTLSSDQGCAILMTSPNAGDGKTTSLMSLAAILAADQKKVLVVDADMRKPSHHDFFGHPLSQGLRSVLSGQRSWPEAIQAIRLGVGSFDSLPAGRMAPAELLSSERMTRFLNDVRSQYDFILIDSPSFPVVADPLVLSVVVDCVLTVLRPHNTDRRVAAEHINRLSEVALSYGVVINDATSAGSSYPARVKVPAHRRVLNAIGKLINTPRRRAIWLHTLSTVAGLVVAAAILVMLFADSRQDSHSAHSSAAPAALYVPSEEPGAEDLTEPESIENAGDHSGDPAAPQSEPAPVDLPPGAIGSDPVPAVLQPTATRPPTAPAPHSPRAAPAPVPTAAPARAPKLLPSAPADSAAVIPTNPY
jgi:tyrosine-protein kinase Etk/Wzc